jgi:hypothetical protein
MFLDGKNLFLYLVIVFYNIEQLIHKQLQDYQSVKGCFGEILNK